MFHTPEITVTRHSFFCIDGHTCGNPVRLVAGGGPQLNGATMIERRARFLADYDWIRTGADVRAARPRRDVGLDPLSADARRIATSASCSSRRRGCLPMCGHGTIGTVTMAIEHGLVHAERRRACCNLDTPAGLVVAEYEQEGRYRRGGAHHQRAVASCTPTRARDRRARARRAHRRRRLWRQFLRHRRAAEELPRHGRCLGRRPAAPVARCCARR